MEFRKQKFMESYEEYYPGAEPGHMTDMYDELKNEYSIRNSKMELVWRKYEHAEALCRGIPIHGVRFDDPMTSKEYFLVEINHFNDSGERCTRYFPHYGFMNCMHLIPHLLPFIKNK
jgi:hypothetical protein